MRQNTDRKEYEKKSIRGAVLGVIIFTLIMIITEAVMIWAQLTEPMPVLLFLSVSLIVIVPVIGSLVVLVMRIKEIKKGEEYEASKY